MFVPGVSPTTAPLGHPPMRGRTHHQPGTNITGNRRPHMAPNGITHQPGTNITGIRRPHMAPNGITHQPGTNITGLRLHQLRNADHRGCR